MFLNLAPLIFNIIYNIKYNGHHICKCYYGEWSFFITTVYYENDLVNVFLMLSKGELLKETVVLWVACFLSPLRNFDQSILINSCFILPISRLKSSYHLLLVREKIFS